MTRPSESARVYPSPLPRWVREHPRRRAECRVYDALAEQLSAPWSVFYSRPWLGLDRHGLDKEGEADFVLIHPELGMLVLEVKGGRISKNAATGEWTSTDGEGYVHSIKDPVSQASRNKHELLKLLQTDSRWGSRRIAAYHAVLFPDCIVPASDLGLDMPKRMFAGIDQMSSLSSWLHERMASIEHAPYVDSLGEIGVGIFTEHFARSFTLARPDAATLQYSEDEIRILTDEQVRALDIFGDCTRIAIPGAAGTGKTALAVEQTRRLAHAGRRTLLLCYNRPLALSLSREVASVANLVVSGFHTLCGDLAQRADVEVERRGTESDFFERELPLAAVKALERLPAERFDAIIIDEGQDFSASWLTTIEALMRAPESSTLIVFFDDKQIVNRRRDLLPPLIPKSGLRLRRILRCGRSIVREVEPILQKPYVAAGPDGLGVRCIELPGVVEPPGVARVLEELVRTERVSPSQITLLVENESQREELIRDSRAWTYRLQDAEAPASAGVVCETVRRYKGLERPVVIVVEPERLIGDPELLYVALTRARSLLVLLASRGRLEQLSILLDRAKGNSALQRKAAS